MIIVYLKGSLYTVAAHSDAGLKDYIPHIHQIVP